MVPTSQLVPATLTDSSWWGRTQSGKPGTVARVPRLRCHTVFGHRGWLESLSWQFQPQRMCTVLKLLQLKLLQTALPSHTRSCLLPSLQLLNHSTTFASHLCQHWMRHGDKLRPHRTLETSAIDLIGGALPPWRVFRLWERKGAAAAPPPRPLVQLMD